MTGLCFNGRLKYTQDIDKYADFIVTAVSTAVDKANLISESKHFEKQPMLVEIVAIIKENGRLRCQYSQTKYPFVRMRINQ